MKWTCAFLFLCGCGLFDTKPDPKPYDFENAPESVKKWFAWAEQQRCLDDPNSQPTIHQTDSGELVFEYCGAFTSGQPVVNQVGMGLMGQTIRNMVDLAAKGQLAPGRYSISIAAAPKDPK